MSQKKNYTHWLWAAAALVALIALFAFNPTNYTLMPKCPFKLLTGWSCPGCGFQRAAHALLHGHVAEAWRFNRFLIYAVPWLLSVMLTEWGLSGERQARWRRIVEGKLAVWGYLFLFCLWGVVRNIWGM